jgi:hypothetical protein
VAAVFVPTHSYSKAIETLTRHNFVVLEGPPEMGKTAIGRMIALSGVARGWDAIECRGPLDVERAYEKQKRQIFVGDDFFGRTEYDPQRVSEWQRSIQAILRLLDEGHWLVLTTRAHLLNFAKQTLDLEGSARRFPDLGEVIVDASNLTALEKARILYRHVKQGHPSAPVRVALRRYGSSISADVNFTPERIRRLVSDVLPTIDPSGSDEEVGLRILRASRDIISDPTRSMRISFRNLREADKWLLFAMLDEAPRLSLRSETPPPVADAYVRLCPPDSLAPSLIF